jgi:hypothetical protein
MGLSLRLYKDMQQSTGYSINAAALTKVGDDKISPA